MATGGKARGVAAAVLGAVVITGLAAGGALAGRGDAVDPALMTPPLNPSFTWECWGNGTRIVCQGARTLSWTAVDTGLPCEYGTIYSTGTDTRTQRRVGDADGRALYTLQTVHIDEVLSLSPTSDGIVGSGRARFTERFEYLIPGDLSTRTDTYRGADAIVTVPGAGLVLHDVGIKSFDIDDNVLFMHGPHPIVEDFEAAFAPVCGALAGIDG